MRSRSFHRRRSDAPRSTPVVTIYHGSTDACPDVRLGLTARCLGHDYASEVVSALVPAEGPVEHLRNALQIIRCTLDFGVLLMGNADGPDIAVSMRHLARLQARVEAALSILEMNGRQP